MPSLLRRITVAVCREVADHLSGDAPQQHLAAQVRELRDRTVAFQGVVDQLGRRIERIAEANEFYASQVNGLSSDAARRLDHVNDVGREVEALRAEASKGAHAFAALADLLSRGVPPHAEEAEREGKDVSTWCLTFSVGGAREAMRLLNGPLG